MPHDMRFRFSERAITDTEVLYRTSLMQFGERSADRYFTIMLEAAQFAADHPRASPERQDTRIPIRVRYFGSHLLAYQIVEDGIVIQRVLHQSQDWVDQL